MDELVTRQVSSSMRNAINANNYKSHALDAKVKTLEAERDLKLLSLQVKTDNIKYSTSPKMKVKKVLSLPADCRTDVIRGGSDSESVTDVESEAERYRRVSSPCQSLPSLQSRTPPRSRRITLSTYSAPPSPRPGSSLRSITSLSGVWETTEPLAFDDQTNTECQQRAPSPRYAITRSRPQTPVLTAKLGSTSTEQAPPTPPHKSNATAAHRGLSIRPLSRNSSHNSSGKQKQPKPGVFSRLYPKQRERPRVESGSGSRPRVESGSGIRPRVDSGSGIRPRVESGSGGSFSKKSRMPSPRLERRRRSVSLPDLSEMLNDLRSCRYLRTSKDDDVFAEDEKNEN